MSSSTASGRSRRSCSRGCAATSRRRERERAGYPGEQRTPHGDGVSYDARFRPPQPETPAPDAFTVHRSVVRDELALGYVHEGIGGAPLLLLHGYPETKRIWWRNIAPLAAAGYEVIVPDLRGHGESDVDPEDRYDIVTYSRDVEVLVRDVLGHERFGVVAGDVGAVVAYDL